jgi:hypothetical protein
MCVTGMNIWFLRQKQAGNSKKRVEHAWLVIVWGFPCAIVLTAITDFFWWESSIVIFWLSSFSLFIISQFMKNTSTLSFGLRFLLLLQTISLLILHITRFGQVAFKGSALLVNTLLIILIFFVLPPLLKNFKKRNF